MQHIVTTASIIVAFTDHEEEEVYTNTVELLWLEHLWNHEDMFETGLVQANEC